MSRVAVFVDAGYLFAQGSAALFGSKRSRSTLLLDEAVVLRRLIDLAREKSKAELLRVYWYDGAPGARGLTPEHVSLAHADHVKLRLGFMNSQGQQKGVDSLIVTDLIELARNRAIGDALLLSGDEDVRVGVQIAQSFGIRVHLLGIFPSRGSQSRQLQQEADTTSEWDRTAVASFLSARPEPPSTLALAPNSVASASIAAVGTAAASSEIETVVQRMVSALSGADLQLCFAHWETGGRGLPSGVDGRMLATCRSVLGRELDRQEKTFARKVFEAAVHTTASPAN